jgi:hypothetical protein
LRDGGGRTSRPSLSFHYTFPQQFQKVEKGTILENVLHRKCGSGLRKKNQGPQLKFFIGLLKRNANMQTAGSEIFNRDWVAFK